ncbi:aspartate aminotransferase family protein [bacterium 1XD8-76]|nr:aspartate aminotransferase family protein [bacterium 1XD8-76]
MQKYITQAEQDLLHTYNRYRIVFDRGEGVYLYDKEGKRYLDFFSGIAVNALGYHYKDFDAVLKAQVDKLLHISNYFYNEPAVLAAAKLKKASGMDRVFFTNSGAEAIEGALKAARKYARTKGGQEGGLAGGEIIAMNHSFHGRTMGALSVTGNPHYREAFEPLVGDIRFADMNDFESVLGQVTEKTCAILFETVQGEGGIYPARKEFMEQVKALCEERDILLILDEIQCGMGRTGKMFAWQHYGIKPDIMACAKAIGGGVPVGAFLMTEKTAEKSLGAGDHGTTYGGNPLACCAVSKMLDLFEENDIIGHVQEIAPWLEEQLDALVSEFDFISARRGLGLMQGLECSVPVGGIISRCLEMGLVLINAGSNILRFVPPLVITREHVGEMVRILREALKYEL